MVYEFKVEGDEAKQPQGCDWLRDRGLSGAGAVSC